MNDNLNPNEERAIDVLLAETLGNAAPPDLSQQIFARLRETPSDVSSIVRTDDRASKSETRPLSMRKQIAIVITVVAALAASLLIAVKIRSDYRMNVSTSTFAGPSNVSDRPELEPGIELNRPQIDPPQAKIADASPAEKRSRGIPLVIDAAPAVQPGAAQDHTADRSPSLHLPLEAVALVSRQVDSELHSYWSAIGIDPTGDASADEIVGRLSIALGIELPAESVNDPQRLENEFARQTVARAIASRWLQQITMRGLERIDPQAKDGLIEDLAACFRSEQEFDRMVAGWIDGQSPNASAFYAAVSAGPKHAGDSSAMVRRLASLTMNVDLRCTRCHDAYIAGNGRQQDYWAFAAFLRHGVTLGPSGQVTINASSESSKSFFYELPDGRQRMVEPAIATTWMKNQKDQPIRSVREWAEQLIESPELARGVVNSLWQLVHGQPLRGRVVDPISAPHNDSLDRLEESLAQDLMRSRFDVARTLALIIASPVTQRAVPTALLPENALVADESETRAAMNAVDAFAAAQPPRNQLPIHDRLDQAMRAVGAKLNTDGNPIVAQIGSPASGAGNTRSDSKSLSADFPTSTKSLPVQWLASIKDHRSQVEHLGYLAGMSQVPENILRAAETMRAADDHSTALNRVWWMVRP